MMNRYGVSLARRFSGGGAVYHDLNNFNYSLFGREDFFSIEKNFQLLERFFGQLQLAITKDKFYSLFIDGYKCSGTAFKNIKGRKLQHGTILLSADAQFIREILRPNNIVLNSKATLSNRSEVKSIADWGKGFDKQELEQKMFSLFSKLMNDQDSQMETVNISSLPNMDIYRQLSGQEWLYGKIPYAKITNNFLGITFSVKKEMVALSSTAGEQLEWYHWNYFCEQKLKTIANKKALSFDRALSEIKV
jgi:lipoate-protein ligase A